jgi:hypothetical protein
MSDPTLSAAQDLLDGSCRALRETVADVEPGALNWRPGEDMNTLAVLITHAAGSTRWWLSVAMGAPIPERDRASEFLATSDSPADLLTWFDQMATECAALLDTDVPFDGGVIRDRLGRGDPVEAAWCLLHALTHLREHVAHAQMTRQLWDQRTA